MLHAGMDMHKHFSVVTVVDDSGNEVVKGRKLENTDVEIVRFFQSLGDEVRVVIEAGSNWMWIKDLLDDYGFENVLFHPLKTKAIASARIKTDKLDSAILSKLLRTDFVLEAYKPDQKTRALRELLRYRSFQGDKRTRIKNAIHALLARENIPNPKSDIFGKAGIAYLSELKLPP